MNTSDFKNESLTTSNAKQYAQHLLALLRNKVCSLPHKSSMQRSREEQTLDAQRIDNILLAVEILINKSAEEQYPKI